MLHLHALPCLLPPVELPPMQELRQFCTLNFFSSSIQTQTLTTSA